MTAVPCKALAHPPARVLFVDDEPATLEMARDILAHNQEIQVLVASNVHEARELLLSEKIDLLVTDLLLPDGNGIALLRELRQLQPQAEGVVMSGTAGCEAPVDAFRGGAVDYVAKPFSATQLTDRVNAALTLQRSNVFREGRLRKLKDAVRRLNVARKTVTKKVDLLCNDLVGAYTELSRKMDGVRLQESFKQFTSGCANLEQLLCHSMDWLLRQLGYCNIGIWLTTADSELQLGAYMKYTVAAETEFVESLQKNLLRMATRRGFVRLREPETKARLTPVESKQLANQDVIAISCTYLGETLGVLLLFRDIQTPFSDDDMAALRVFSPLFALALAQAVRGGKADEGEEPGGPGDQFGDAGATPDAGEQDRPRKCDPSDWWKRGEAPPF